jgi:hypothetical protein
MDKYKMMSYTDQSVWDEKRWNLKTSNVPVGTIEALDIDFEIKSGDIDSVGGGLELQTGTNIRLIDQSVHLSLLEGNIKEYRDIWRELAGK